MCRNFAVIATVRAAYRHRYAMPIASPGEAYWRKPIAVRQKDRASWGTPGVCLRGKAERLGGVSASR